MDPPAIVKTIRYNPSPLSSSSTQKAMFSVPEAHIHHRPFPQSNSAVEDLSFNSYVKTKDPSKKSPEENTNCTIDDTEISIFDAQKYFSETDDHKDVKRQGMIPHDMLSVPRLISVSSADEYGRNFRSRSSHATPTASSEASWNSRTGLLVNPPGSMEVSMKNSDSKRTNSNARKWIFGGKCCCTGKKSVQVKEAGSGSDLAKEPVITTTDNNNSSPKSSYSVVTPSNSILSPRSNSITSDILEIHQNKIMPQNPRRLSPENSFQTSDSPKQQRVSVSGMAFGDASGGFSFPILNPSLSSQTTNKGITRKPVINPLEDPPRDSLEVFQPIHDRQAVPRLPSLDNPMSERLHFNPGSPIARDDDMCSDASSELFEIESFSTQTTSYPMYRSRDSLDEASTFNHRRFATTNGNSAQFNPRSLDEAPASSVAATECYAPSEVSIDWSVTTAEGFDRASVSNFSLSASEFGSAAMIRQPVGDVGKKKGIGGGGGMLLMSCRHDKAVSVGPQPVKCEGPGMFPVQVGGGRPPRANKAAMGSSHAARLSLAFAA